MLAEKKEGYGETKIGRRKKKIHKGNPFTVEKAIIQCPTSAGKVQLMILFLVYRGLGIRHVIHMGRKNRYLLNEAVIPVFGEDFKRESFGKRSRSSSRKDRKESTNDPRLARCEKEEDRPFSCRATRTKGGTSLKRYSK